MIKMFDSIVLLLSIYSMFKVPHKIVSKTVKSGNLASHSLFSTFPVQNISYKYPSMFVNGRSDMLKILPVTIKQRQTDNCRTSELIEDVFLLLKCRGKSVVRELQSDFPVDFRFLIAPNIAPIKHATHCKIFQMFLGNL